MLQKSKGGTNWTCFLDFIDLQCSLPALFWIIWLLLLFFCFCPQRLVALDFTHGIVIKWSQNCWKVVVLKGFVVMGLLQVRAVKFWIFWRSLIFGVGCEWRILFMYDRRGRSRDKCVCAYDRRRRMLSWKCPRPFSTKSNLNIPFVRHTTEVEYERQMCEMLHTDITSEIDVVEMSCCCLPRPFCVLWNMGRGYLGSRRVLKSVTEVEGFALWLE